MADLKKQEKSFDQRMTGINSKCFICVFYLVLNVESNAGLNEQNNKLKSEIQNLKLTIKEKQIQIDELVAQIKLMADADKQMSEMK